MTDLATSTFDSYIERYVSAIRQVRYQDLPLLQPAPYANLAFGAAGTAYALVRLAEASRLSDGHRLAVRLLRDALRDRTHGATRGVDVPTTSARSFTLGRSGIHAITAMALSTRNSDGRRHAIKSYVRAGRGATELEYMDGAAGHLLGVCMLLRKMRDDPLLRLGVDLAERLTDRTRRKVRRPWSPVDATGFAHGWPGVLFALLAWRAANEEALEGWLVDSLLRLARVERPGPGTIDMRGTWCNGAAGVALLWCRVFKCTREKVFLRAAHNSAREAVRYLPVGAHLCCGMGGVAYALLAVERVDPERGWRERAIEVGERAITTPLATRRPNGLLWGHPGLVCLALDLLSGEPRGFPCVEG